MALLFAYGQSSHGVATSKRDTPRDVLSIRKSNDSFIAEFSFHGFTAIVQSHCFESKCDHVQKTIEKGCVNPLTCLRFARAAQVAIAQPVAVGPETTSLAEGFALYSCGEKKILLHSIYVCRKICGLGCVSHSMACARFTQPSPHIFLHFCMVIIDTREVKPSSSF